MDEERKLKIKGLLTKAMALVYKVDAGGLTAEKGFIHRYPLARIFSSSSAQ